ncbi:SLBB domain-containing protein [Methylobacterium sp. E-016]|uniref:polysaccharide biosynthesis/export family protein n=1 Tax=Methylobacterium sp. E-016 TaxID=2836556 RepID=UPI001FBB1AFD|nr:SLBB domain-containing protein [Methylobacterium sp. E-016]MCJ2076364.1 SLBB domain-containing protein [Methylobacterium sp. E-016]
MAADTTNRLMTIFRGLTVSTGAVLLFMPLQATGAGVVFEKADPATPIIATRDTIKNINLLHEGDKLRLVFYERLENDEDKWRGGRNAVPRGFHQRSELTGEYVIGEDGTVSLPMLGRFPGAGLTQDAFLASLSMPFEDLIGRKGFVNVVAIEHRPIYIVGPVKNPGAFKFESGMTVLHALALAGGLREKEPEAWQRIEFGREVERLQRNLDRAKRLIARTTVLQAERDDVSVSQGDLASLAGKAGAAALVGEESWQRNLTTMSRGAQENALKTALVNARTDLASRSDRLGPLDATIAMRVERVTGMTNLADRNVIGRPVLIQAQSELGDAQDRRQQALLDLEGARKRVADSERDLERFRLENRLEVSKVASVAKREATDTLDEGQGLLDVVKALSSEHGPSDVDGELEYEIVRRNAGGAVILPVSPTAILLPGDLVRLKQPDRAPSVAPVAFHSVPGSEESSVLSQTILGPNTTGSLQSIIARPGAPVLLSPDATKVIQPSPPRPISTVHPSPPARPEDVKAARSIAGNSDNRQ